MSERMIFSLNTGRCGTAYIYRMMTTVPDVVSLHEPPPFFHEAANLYYDDKKKWLEEIKIPYIQGLAQSVYFESSAQFARGFVAPILALEYVPDVLVIRRNLSEVALSMWRNHMIPGRSPVSETYGIRPNDVDALLYYSNYSRWTDYQCCYWMCLEMQARMNEGAKMIAEMGGMVVETTTPKMTTQAGFFEILDSFGLERPDMVRYGALWNVPFNSTRYELQLKWAGGDIPKQEQEIKGLFNDDHQ